MIGLANKEKALDESFRSIPSTPIGLSFNLSKGLFSDFLHMVISLACQQISVKGHLKKKQHTFRTDVLHKRSKSLYQLKID